MKRLYNSAMWTAAFLTLVTLVAVLTASCSKSPEESAEQMDKAEGAETETENFPDWTRDNSFAKDVLESESPVLVMFTTSWCAICRRAEPVINDMARDYRDTVKVLKIDGDTNKTSARTHGVNAYPTVLVFRRGKVVHRAVGASKNPDEIRTTYENLLALNRRLDDFERPWLDSGIPAFVWFTKPSCVSCEQLDAMVDELAWEYYGSVHVTKFSIESKEDLYLRDFYGIRAVPTAVLFIGTREAGRIQYILQDPSETRGHYENLIKKAL